MDKKLIQPRILSGFRDLGSAEVRVRDRMMEKIRRVFELFGFDPLDTTTVEFLEVLTGGQPGWDQMGIYQLDSSLERHLTGGDPNFWDKKIALRFDLTVSLARYVAANLNRVPRPFKRYQLGKVYRAETPQEGRYREFYQFDADTMFAPDVIADAEIVALMVETMKTLEIARFRVKVNNRKLMEGVPALLGINDVGLNDLLRILDKRDKIGREEMLNLLKNPTNKVTDPGLGLSDEQTVKLMSFAEMQGDTAGKLEQCARMFAGIPIAEVGIAELGKMAAYLKAMGVNENLWEIDLSVVRGLSYYTGPVFETQLLELPGIGSVFSGGRFDNLVSRFAVAKVPGTGASVGVDRLFTALTLLKRVELAQTGVQILVARMTTDSVIEAGIAGQLRAAGFNVLVYDGEVMNFKAQFNRAVKFDIPYIVIAGVEELARGEVTVRDLRARTQACVPITDVASYFLRQRAGT